MITIKTIAGGAVSTGARARFHLYLGALALLAGCSVLPDKPQRPVQYDFGPGPLLTAASPPGPERAPLALADIESAGVLEGSSALLYRLTYADAQQLRPYALARWSMPPAQLVHQRVRQQFGLSRPVLTAGEGAALTRTGGVLPAMLRLDLEEFSHVFESATQSYGMLRLRTTLVDNTPGGERLRGQRVFAVRRPAATPDASGGAKALAEATDQIAREIEAWVDAQPVVPPIPPPVPQARPPAQTGQPAPRR